MRSVSNRWAEWGTGSPLDMMASGVSKGDVELHFRSHRAVLARQCSSNHQGNVERPRLLALEADGQRARVLVGGDGDGRSADAADVGRHRQLDADRPFISLAARDAHWN